MAKAVNHRILTTRAKFDLRLVHVWYVLQKRDVERNIAPSTLVVHFRNFRTNLLICYWQCLASITALKGNLTECQHYCRLSCGTVLFSTNTSAEHVPCTSGQKKCSSDTQKLGQTASTDALMPWYLTEWCHTEHRTLSRYLCCWENFWHEMQEAYSCDLAVGEAGSGELSG